MKSKKLICMLILSILLLVAGCGSGVKKSTADGNLLSLSFDEISSGVFYVLDLEKATIHPLYRDGQSFESGVELSKNGEPVLVGRYIWMVNDEKLIPIVQKGVSELIYFDNTKIVAKEVTLEKFIDSGYTTGTTFSEIPDSDYLGLNNVTINTTSQAGKLISSETNKEAFILTKINDVPLNRSILDENGVITGLAQNGKYIVSGYKGTEYRELTLISDTHYFKSVSLTSIPRQTAYTFNKKGYATINIPSDLESGYYLVNGAGLFYYDADAKSNQDQAITDSSVQSTSPLESTETTTTSPSLDPSDLKASLGTVIADADQ